MAILNQRSSTPALRDSAGVREAALTVLFFSLLAFNIWRTMHHAMWRDEMQIYLLGAYNPSLSDLFHYLRYEPHPDLWHALVWLGARVYAHPASMQVIHILLAACVWLLIWRASPFRTADKILLLLSYFLFWEYFVVSRQYVLVALAGFAFVAVRALRPQRMLLSFILLGVLANTMVFATIWSMVAAARLALERNGPASMRFAGISLYLICLAAAVAGMVPAPDNVTYDPYLRFNPSDLSSLGLIPSGALLPVNPRWLAQAAGFLLHPGGGLPLFWNPNPFGQILALAHGDIARTLVTLGFLVAPPLVCWALVRDWKLAAEFTLAYLGIVVFAGLWNYPGLSRQHGIVFVALVCAVWMANARAPLSGWRAAGWRLLLVISAIGGLLTLISETRVFSHGRTVAEWLTRNRLADAFIMGSRDTTLSTISGYLGRPLYYLECECFGRFIVWNTMRTQFIDAAEIARRVNRTPLAEGGRETILITNREIPVEVARETAPNRTLTLLESFTRAEVESENYWVFRVTPKS
jgi:hypothetical protein